MNALETSVYGAQDDLVSDDLIFEDPVSMTVALLELNESQITHAPAYVLRS